MVEGSHRLQTWSECGLQRRPIARLGGWMWFRLRTLAW